MGIFRPSREPGPRSAGTLHQRMALFAVGAIVGLAGIASGTPWILYLAVGILAVGVLLRFGPR
jgi:hypothetical protein